MIRAGMFLWLFIANLGFADVRIVRLEGRAEPPIVPAVFANQTQQFTVEISGMAGKTGSLRADLFQVANKLEMPLGQSLYLKEGVTFESNSQEVPLSIKFPDVKARARIRVHLTFVQTTPEPMGDLLFDVFPVSLTRDLLDSFKVQDSSPLPVVFGPGNELRQFLKNHHLKFDEGGPNVPDQFESNRCLYFGELTSKEQFETAMDRSSGKRVVLVFLDDALPPGIYVDRSESAVVAHENSSLANLETDPREQAALLKIITLVSSAKNP